MGGGESTRDFRASRPTSRGLQCYGLNRLLQGRVGVSHQLLGFGLTVGRVAIPEFRVFPQGDRYVAREITVLWVNKPINHNVIVVMVVCTHDMFKLINHIIYAYPITLTRYLLTFTFSVLTHQTRHPVETRNRMCFPVSTSSLSPSSTCHDSHHCLSTLQHLFQLYFYYKFYVPNFFRPRTFM